MVYLSNNPAEKDKEVIIYFTYLMFFPKESIAANPLLRGDILE